MIGVENGKDFGDAITSAKLVRTISNLVRRARLDYEAFRRVCGQVRKEIGLRRPRHSRRLPRILPEASLRRFYQEIDRAGDLQHQIMLRLLFYTAVRVSELVSIAVNDMDLDGCKIFIDRGKGDKDRYILFPESFRLILKSHLAANPKNRYCSSHASVGSFPLAECSRSSQAMRGWQGCPSASTHTCFDIRC